jgi:hypothetical protein
VCDFGATVGLIRTAPISSASGGLVISFVGDSASRSRVGYETPCACATDDPSWSRGDFTQTDPHLDRRADCGLPDRTRLPSEPKFRSGGILREGEELFAAQLMQAYIR